MRLLLLVTTICVSCVGVESSAEAQNHPWCAMLNMGDQAVNCGFTTFQQCMDTVSGIGGFCMQNNTYQPTPGSNPLIRRRYPY
jgi:hypothetical protein